MMNARLTFALLALLITKITLAHADAPVADSVRPNLHAPDPCSLSLIINSVEAPSAFNERTVARGLELSAALTKELSRLGYYVAPSPQPENQNDILTEPPSSISVNLSDEEDESFQVSIHLNIETRPATRLSVEKQLKWSGKPTTKRLVRRITKDENPIPACPHL